MKNILDYFQVRHFDFMSRFISIEFEINFHDLYLSPYIRFDAFFLISFTHWSGKRVEHYMSITDIETICLSMLYKFGITSYSYKAWKRVYKSCLKLQRNYFPVSDDNLPF